MTGEIENDIIIMFRLNGLVAQLVRARASHARGRRFEPYRVHHLCSTKKLQNKKGQDLVGLVLFCCYILWFAHLAEYLNSGAAFS